MIDADIMGLGKLETIAYVKLGLGQDEKQFSEGSYKKYRAEALSDENNVNWISYYARQGFVGIVSNVPDGEVIEIFDKDVQTEKDRSTNRW